MKPYTEPPNVTSSQSTFNTALSAAREKIIQSFGLLRGRWRCLMETLKEDTLRVPTTVIACCVLHNLCIEEGDDAPVEPAIIQNDVDVNVEDSNEGPVDDEDGILLREAISNYLERHSNIY